MDRFLAIESCKVLVFSATNKGAKRGFILGYSTVTLMVVAYLALELLRSSR